ncbi:MAG: hypothetical protein PHG34_08210 [Candidatus Cloacimonetes bacterium]|jgi:hypothetical protein|nr:hypothetical protein [Candidatus Cloacimonadota bacterium]
MGTQQLLLIVLGVIIVGVAIAVGITIFNNQAYNANQQAVASELNTYGSMVLQWWKTPESQGGAGKVDANLDVDEMAKAIGFIQTGNTLSTDTGSFTIIDADAAEAVQITGTGNEKKGNNYPFVTATVNLISGKITAEIGTTTVAPVDPDPPAGT